MKILKKSYLVVFLILLLSTTGFVATTDDAVDISNLKKITVTRDLKFYEDNSKRLTIEIISAKNFQKYFKKNKKDSTNFGYKINILGKNSNSKPFKRR